MARVDDNASTMDRSSSDLYFIDSDILSTFCRSKTVSIVVAMTPKGGIGKKNGLPWARIAKDQQHFAKVTTFVPPSKAGCRNVVILGRRCWESIPPQHRPLKDRLNIIISSTMSEADVGASGVKVCTSLPRSLLMIEQEFKNEVNEIFVIGGTSLYECALALNVVDNLYITRVAYEYECDVYVSPPECSIKKSSSDVISSADTIPLKPAAGVWFSNIKGFETTYISKTFGNKTVTFDFIVMEKRKSEGLDEAHVKDGTRLLNDCKRLKQNNVPDITHPALAAMMHLEGQESRTRKEILVAAPQVSYRKHEEFQYLDLIADLINTGVEQPDRTGVGILSKFGKQMRFSLSESFPLLTTKRVFWKGVVQELLWFIKADTNANHLTDIGVKIWEKNATREFLDSLGLTHREPGDIGPAYGFQWRHFGADYKDMHANYDGQGVDQLQNVINKLRTNPTDRRIIMSAWNPAALHLMALPPCHMLSQFYVADGELSCIMYQRSCDVGLGVPFNIASYSLLTIMIAHICNLKPKEFIHFMANTHIYKNHVEALKKQIVREPRPFPLLKIVGDNIKEIDDFKPEHFELIGYNPHGIIKMEMAV